MHAFFKQHPHHKHTIKSIMLVTYTYNTLYIPPYSTVKWSGSNLHARMLLVSSGILSAWDKSEIKYKLIRTWNTISVSCLDFSGAVSDNYSGVRLNKI